MEKFFTLMKEALENKNDVMIVGISAVSGSAPRGAGARMLVSESGRVCGTIGGGSVEHETELQALALLKEKTSGMQSFRLASNNVKDLGMVCGGEMLVFFQYISAFNHQFVDLCNLALQKIKGGEVCWLITGLTDATNAQMGIYSEKSGFYGVDVISGLNFADTPHMQRAGNQDYLIEPLVRAGTVYIFGGGHVSQALVPVAARVGFRCAVFDDREEFANPTLFPDAAKVGLIDFKNIANLITITKSDYVVIMTRGHQYDSSLQAQAMRTDARYIGVMGSNSKIAHVSAQMRELGFTDADLARIKTPIGVNIKAETPEEIAVSITAELIMVRASSSANLSGQLPSHSTT